MASYPRNYPFYNWIPKPLGILILVLLFIPILTVGGVYTANSGEMMSGLGIQSEHIQFVGFPCRYDACKTLKQRDWITLTAKVNIKYHPIYKGQTPDSAGPVLTAVKVEPAEKPLDDVVMFS